MDKNNITIMIVDDEVTNCMILEKILKNQGYNIIIANSAKECLKKLSAPLIPDLILLDIVMPEEDGFEVLDRLKTNPYTKPIPIIIITALDGIEDKKKGFGLGAVDYIVRPFNHDEVKLRVRTHICLARMHNSVIENLSLRLNQLKEFQESIMVKPRDFPNAKFEIYYKTVHEAGGDFYDVVETGNSVYGYFLGDISGHEIKTSFMIPVLKLLMQQYCIPIYDPIESMRIINEVLLKFLPDDTFLTGCYISLNRNQNKVTLITMGNHYPVYCKKISPPTLLKITGDILGKFKDVEFGQIQIDVTPKDRFFIYSDGLIEKQEKNGEYVYCYDYLVQCIEKTGNMSISDCPHQINKLVHQKYPDITDDIVIMGIEV
ncbi:MAG: response regulator [Desulfobacterales bacterium]|nr:response regulator [Desulfobacterales bacterium]